MILANRAAQAIDQARRWVVARRELAHRTALLRIAGALDAADSSKQVLRVLLNGAIRTVGAEDGGVAWWDEGRGALVEVLRSLAVANGTALDSRRSLVRLAAPLVHDNRLLGATSLSNLSAPRPFHGEDACTVDLLASAAAIMLAGIERARVVGATLALCDATVVLNDHLTTSLGSLDRLRTSTTMPRSAQPLLDEALSGLERAAGRLAQLQHQAHSEPGSGPFGLHRDLGAPPTDGAMPAHYRSVADGPALGGLTLDDSAAPSAGDI